MKTNQVLEFTKMIFSNLFYIISAIIAIKGEITIGTFIVISEYFFKVSDTLGYLVNNNFDMEMRQGSVNRIKEIAFLSGENLNENKNNEKDILGNIKFKNMVFSHNIETKLLGNLNLKIMACFSRREWLWKNNIS